MNDSLVILVYFRPNTGVRFSFWPLRARYKVRIKLKKEESIS